MWNCLGRLEMLTHFEKRNQVQTLVASITEAVQDVELRVKIRGTWPNQVTAWKDPGNRRLARQRVLVCGSTYSKNGVILIHIPANSTMHLHMFDCKSHESLQKSSLISYKTKCCLQCGLCSYKLWQTWLAVLSCHKVLCWGRIRAHTTLHLHEFDCRS